MNRKADKTYVEELTEHVGQLENTDRAAEPATGSSSGAQIDTVRETMSNGRRIFV